MQGILSIYLSIYLFVHLSIYLSVNLSIYLPEVERPDGLHDEEVCG